MSFCDQDYDYEPTDDDIRQMLDDEALYWSGYEMHDAPATNRPEPKPTVCPWCRGDLDITDAILPRCDFPCDYTWGSWAELYADHAADHAADMEAEATR